MDFYAQKAGRPIKHEGNQIGRCLQKTIKMYVRWRFVQFSTGRNPRRSLATRRDDAARLLGESTDRFVIPLSPRRGRFQSAPDAFRVGGRWLSSGEPGVAGAKTRLLARRARAKGDPRMPAATCLIPLGGSERKVPGVPPQRTCLLAGGGEDRNDWR